MKILARANKKLRGNGKFYAIPEPTKSWFYVTEYDSDGYFKAKTIGCSGAMPYNYMYGAYRYDSNVITSFLKELKINEGVTSISEYAFNNCYYLTSITIPNSVTSIGREAFLNCNILKSITIPDEVTSIEVSTFENCSGLKIMTFGSGITTIKNYAFTSVSRCVFDFRKATAIPTLENVDAFIRTSSSKKIVVPDSLYDEWITATNWSSTSNNIVNCIIKASDYEASL